MRTLSSAMTVLVCPCQAVAMVIRNAGMVRMNKDATPTMEHLSIWVRQCLVTFCSTSMHLSMGMSMIDSEIS
jgi:hypothetical protein